jgi:hypothetical protein
VASRGDAASAHAREAQSGASARGLERGARGPVEPRRGETATRSRLFVPADEPASARVDGGDTGEVELAAVDPGSSGAPRTELDRLLEEGWEAPEDEDLEEPGGEGDAPAMQAERPRVPSASRAVASAPPVGMRAEIVAASERLVGIRNDFTAESFIQHVLGINHVALPDPGEDRWIRELYRALKADGLTYDREQPLPGDLVFFHNTADDNGDARNNDWYSLAGVVKAVDAHGTVTFIAYVGDEVQELVMNVARPEVRRDETEGAVLNSFVRAKKLSDPEHSRYLAGELFAGFASAGLP